MSRQEGEKGKPGQPGQGQRGGRGGEGGKGGEGGEGEPVGPGGRGGEGGKGAQGEPGEKGESGAFSGLSRILFWAWVVAFTAVAIYGIRSNRILAQEGKEGKEAICAFRNDLEMRADKTQRILDDNPKEKAVDLDPDPDTELIISRSTLENSVNGQRQVIRVVDRTGIDCREEVKDETKPN